MSSAMEQEAYRHLPYDIDVEQAVLGAILKDNSAMEHASALIKQDAFYDPLHGRIFAAMSQMIERGGVVVTALTLHAMLKSDAGVIETGGQAYFDALCTAAPAIPNIKDCANILTDLAARRALIKIGEDIVNNAYEPPADKPTAASIAEAQQGLVAAADRAGEMAGSSLPMFSAADWAGKEVPARQEFVEGLIPARTVTLLSGDGGTGKSLIAAQLAAATLTGATWLGRVVFGEGPVIYLSAEDDDKELHRRFVSIVESQGASLERLADLHILPLVGEDALLAVPDWADTLEATSLFRAIEGQIRKIRPGLVILDNLSDIFGGNENSRVQAVRFVTMLKGWCAKYDLTLVLLAHVSLNGMANGSGISGSTGWHNSTRSRLYFLRVADKNGEEDDPDVRVLRNKKLNYGRKGAEIRVRWDNGVFRPEIEAGSPAAEAAAARADRVFLDMLRIYTAERRLVGATTGHGYAPAVFAEDKRAEGLNKAALADAMNRHFKAGKIRTDVSGPPSRQRKFLVEVETPE